MNSFRQLAVVLGLAFAAVTAAAAPPLPMLHTQGTQWVTAQGKPVQLKGANLGNWLMLEFWMMGQRSPAMDDQCTLEAKFDERFGYAERERLMQLFRDNWIKERDWDLLPQFGLNLVRLPFIWNLIEDEKRPRHLRADAWKYLDATIAAAEARGMYVILDLHGAVGAQGLEHHSGCAGKNLYWSTPEYQERTTWLWQQIAKRYKNRSAVAGYSLLNEPWGTTPEEMARVMKKLYRSVRAVDTNHAIIFPGHHSGIDAYGKPSEQGMRNVAFEMHFYPGHFGWAKPEAAVHQNWLQCLPDGKGLCEWRDRLQKLDTAFFVGEFQPWADMDLELGGQIARASFDAYAAEGWATSLWAYKMMNNRGGHQPGNWGIVTNKAGTSVPAIDFAIAPLQDIEALFKQFGSVEYEPHPGVMKWMRSTTPPDPFKTFDMQTHRGGRGLWPENTLAAFENAIRMGTTTLELDIAITADGVPVISHDPALNPAYTRDAQGQWLTRHEPRIKDMTLAEVRRYDVGRLNPAHAYGKSFATQQAVDGQRIPTLASLFQLVKDMGAAHIQFDMETKINPHHPEATLPPAEFVPVLLKAIRDAGMTQRVMVQSFDWRTLELLHTLEPQLRTMYLTMETEGYNTPKDSAWTAGHKLAQYKGSVPHMVRASAGNAKGVIWAPAFYNLTPEGLKASRALGLKVIPWTVNEKPDMQRMLEMGVDGIISDYPDRLRAVMAQAGLPLPPAVAK
jgi:endoglucanase